MDTQRNLQEQFDRIQVECNRKDLELSTLSHQLTLEKEKNTVER